MNICIFVPAGDFSAAYFTTLRKALPEAPIFAIDGGYNYVRKMGELPAVAVGDFDSLGFIPEGVEIIKHPVRKDKTDMLLAVDTALERGFDTAFVLGALGGRRFDHSIANMQSLFYRLPDFNLIYLDDSSLCFAVKDGRVLIEGDSLRLENCWELPAEVFNCHNLRQKNLSIFARNTASVTIEGCNYNGSGLELVDSFPLGASNAVMQKSAKIDITGDVSIVFSGVMEAHE